MSGVAGRGPAPGWELVCLPPAGGSAASFRRWTRHAPADVLVRPLVRDADARRTGRSLVEEAGALARGLAATAGGSGYLLVGHSLGGLLAYETVRALVERSWPLPAAVVVLGTRPPHLSSADYFAPVVALDDDGMLGALSLMGVVNPQLRDSPLRSLFLPGLRSDLRLIAGYRPRDLPALPVDLHAWHATEDALAPPDVGSGWARYTTRGFVGHTVAGDHFFPVDDGGGVFEALVRLGREVCRGQQQPVAG